MDFSFLLQWRRRRGVVGGEGGKGCCLGQPSTWQALISHLDAIYCGLHRENSVYCNRDHNYHRSALSQDLCRVRVRWQMGRALACAAVVCVLRETFVHALMDLHRGSSVYLNQHLYGPLPLPLSLDLVLFFSRQLLCKMRRRVTLTIRIIRSSRR